MARGSNTLPLLLVALVLAGALAVLAGGLLEGNGDARPAPSDLAASTGPARPAPEPAPPQAPAAAIPEIPAVTVQEPAELLIAVVDAKRRPFTEVHIELLSPRGELFEISEPGLLSDLEPGVWRIEASSKTLLPARESVELFPGRRRRVTLELLDYLRISGRVRDDHGAPVLRTPVWLLPAGGSHPPSESTAMATTSATTAKGGNFRMRVPGPGSYRFSVGPPGQALWVQDVNFQIQLDGPRHAELVVPSQGRLIIRMAPDPSGDPTARAKLEIEALARLRPGGEGSVDPALAALGYGDAPQAAGTFPLAKSLKGFIPWLEVRVPGAGELPVENAPLDRELRLVLHHQGKRLNADRSLRLSPGVTNRVTLFWPQPGGPAGALKFLFEHVPPPEAAPPVGCTWAE